MKSLSIALASILSCVSAHGAERKILYNEKIVAFADWHKKDMNEALVLNLFPGFMEPMVEVHDNGIRKQKLLKMMMYITRGKTVLNRPSTNINLSSLISEQTIKRLDSEAVHKRISSTEAMPSVAGRGNIENFKWCNKNQKQPDIFLPALERSLNHMVRPDRKWCPDDQRTSCYEICRVLPPVGAISSAIALYNSNKKPGKDFGIATQAEVRYFMSENEYGAKAPLSHLTGLNTPISGILEISFFYFDQIMLYGKYLVILQPNQGNPQQTMMTALTAFGVREHDWNHKMGGPQVQALLKSESNMNASTGILAGIPTFSRHAIQGLGDLLDK